MFNIMKAALGVALVCAWGMAAMAEDSTRTAYGALRVIGKQSGEDALNRVLEVRGRSGAPEPDVWKVTLDDPTARGGIRVLEVQRGQVISEKTPTGRTTGGRINFNQLNLDSEGVFTVVNQQAQKAGVTFDHVDYTLQSGAQKGSPVWHIDLQQGAVGKVGEFDVAADTGTVLRKDLSPKASRPPVVDDHAYVQPAPPRAPLPPPRYAEEDRRYPDDTTPEPYVRRYEDRRVYVDEDPDDDYPVDGTPFADRVQRHFEKRGKQFKNFFTGRGWTDR